MISKRHYELILNLISLLNDEEKMMYRQVTDYLLELGYIPQKQNVQGDVLSFKHKEFNKVIARIGIRNGKTQSAFLVCVFLHAKIILRNFMMLFNMKLNLVTDSIANKNLQMYCRNQNRFPRKTGADVVAHVLEEG